MGSGGGGSVTGAGRDGSGSVTGGGGDQVRLVAARARSLADEVREVQARLAVAHGVAWRSAAADGYRARLAGQVAAVRRSAAAVDDVVHALVRHAQALDSVPRLPVGPLP